MHGAAAAAVWHGFVFYDADTVGHRSGVGARHR